MPYFIYWIIAGIATGLVGQYLFPKVWFGGVPGNIAISIAGAIAGGWLFNTYVGDWKGAWSGGTFGAILGGLFLLGFFRLFLPNKPKTT